VDYDFPVRRVIIALSLLTVTATATAALAGSSAPSTPFLLVLGGSTSQANQPYGLENHLNTKTDDGYQDIIAKTEKYRGYSFRVFSYGCPGATLRGMFHPTLRLKSDGCYKKNDSQIKAAVRFLQRHHDEYGVVTIDLGQNILHSCMSRNHPTDTCLNKGVDDVRLYLTRVVKALVKAKGPHTTLLGLTFFDPFVTMAQTHRVSWTQVQHDHTFFVRANHFATTIYEKYGVGVVDLAAAFGSDNWTPVLSGDYMVPSNVVHACQLTWECFAPPFGPDPHPTRAGYIVIADAIMRQMPPPWRYDALGWTPRLAIP
jgi:hypothetical protein